MTLSVLVWSAPGAGKTSFALSGSGRKWYAELDANSYERSVAGLPVDEALITKQEFYVPLTSLRDRARLNTAMVGSSGKGAVQFVHKLEGYDEKLQEFFNSYVDALEQDYDRLIVDTSTKLNDLMQFATRQRIQQTSSPDQWESNLKRLEYSEPNSQMSQIVEAAGQFKKNLVLVAHATEVWEGGNPTGRYKADGNKHIPGLVDLVLRFAVEDKQPVATIEKAGIGGLGLTGMKIVAPSFDEIEKLVSDSALIRKMGGTLPNPLTPESIATAAKVFQAAML